MEWRQVIYLVRSETVILEPEEDDVGEDLFGPQATISSSGQDGTACAKTPSSPQLDANMESSSSEEAGNLGFGDLVIAEDNVPDQPCEA